MVEPQPAEEVKLEEVCAWLVVNSMRSEKVQFQMLSEQSIENVWRKQAFNTLMTEWKTVGTDKMSRHDEGRVWTCSGTVWTTRWRMRCLSRSRS